MGTKKIKEMKSFIVLIVVFGLTLGLVMANDEDITYTVTSEAWFDVSVKESKEAPNETAENIGRIVIGLFGDIAPMTATNFGQLAKGVKRSGGVSD